MNIELEGADNLYIWNEKRTVPAENLKPITGGRLKGKSDISPQWRLQALTEMLGPCGVGWKYETVGRDVHEFNNEVSVHTRINLYIKVADKWSDAIEGQGGAMLVEKEKNGLYHNDEAFKMATTDALSVACKQLGIAADVYLGKADSKYQRPREEVRDLTPARIAIRNAKTLDELKEVWHKVNIEFTGDRQSLGVLNAEKDKVKKALQDNIERDKIVGADVTMATRILP